MRAIIMICIVAAAPAWAGSSVNHDTTAHGGVTITEAPKHVQAENLNLKQLDALEKRWSKLLDAIAKVEKDSGYKGEDYEKQTDKKRGIMGANIQHWLAFKGVTQYAKVTESDFAEASKDRLLCRYIIVSYWFKFKLDSDRKRALAYHYGVSETEKMKEDPDKYWDTVKSALSAKVALGR